MSVFYAILKIFFGRSSSWRFAVGVLLGLSFSITVILGTIGIMDGFQASFKSALRHSGGEMSLYSTQGLFPLNPNLADVLNHSAQNRHTLLFQSEAFLMAKGESQGVLARGIEPISFKSVSGMDIRLKEGEVAIGLEMAKKLKLEKGDQVALVFASPKNQAGLPILQRLTVAQIISHGIYQKDMRLIYLPREELQSIIGAHDRYNLIMLNMPPGPSKETDRSYSERMEEFSQKLREDLDYRFVVRPFWKEYSSLLEAVQIEKIVIGIIMQLVVVIAVFNALAFIIFLFEKSAKEIFLFRALGLSQRQLSHIWFGLIFILWPLACALSMCMLIPLDWALGHLSVFQLPGDIYYIRQLTLMIAWSDYALVFGLALVWMILIVMLGLLRMKKRSILYGLRREFA